jgi:hypothetical protein
MPTQLAGYLLGIGDHCLEQLAIGEQCLEQVKIGQHCLEHVETGKICPSGSILLGQVRYILCTQIVELIASLVR